MFEIIDRCLHLEQVGLKANKGVAIKGLVAWLQENYGRVGG